MPGSFRTLSPASRWVTSFTTAQSARAAILLLALADTGRRVTETSDHARAIRLVALVCAAQVLVQIGAFFWPALLPQMIARWALTNSEAGWITAAFYGAYMLAVPVLVTLTDRIDAKLRLSLRRRAHRRRPRAVRGSWRTASGRRSPRARSTGIGWAGTYMTGLKLLADTVDGKLLSRAATGHAASIGISGALSFACADLLARHRRMALRIRRGGGERGASRGSSCRSPCRAALSGRRRRGRPALFDFRPVLRNRSAMAYAIAYGIHTLEMSALRGWGVAFLAFVAAGDRRARRASLAGRPR